MTEYPQGRYDVPVMFPRAEGESAENWTNRLSSEGSSRGLYRQCSIGWHHECSQRFEGEDADCRCSCHLLIPDDIDDEGDEEFDESTGPGLMGSPEFLTILDAARMWGHELSMEIIPNADPAERRGYQASLDELETALTAMGGEEQ